MVRAFEECEAICSYTLLQWILSRLSENSHYNFLLTRDIGKWIFFSGKRFKRSNFEKNAKVALSFISHIMQTSEVIEIK